MTSTHEHLTAAKAPLPHPRFRLPFLGDLATIDFAKPTQGLARESQRHNGLFEQRIFKLPVVVVSSPQLIDDVNDEAHWEKHLGHSIWKLRSVAGDGLFTASNDESNWQKAHNVLMPAFSKTALTHYHDSICGTVDEFIDAWDAHASNSTWIDVPAEANRLAIEIIARAGFGHSFTRLTDNTDNEFVRAVLRELAYANRRTDAIPVYEKVFGRKRAALHYADKKFIRAEVDRIIQQRRTLEHRDAAVERSHESESSPSTTPHADMLDIMLNSVDPDSGDTLDDNNIGNQILTFLVAGSETSANTIAFALHYLSTHPQVTARARSEIDELWPDRAVTRIEFGDVAKLRYLRRVVDETLRLWPVAPGYFRQAKHDTTIGDGRYVFGAGEWVFVLLVAAHRHPAWGPSADMFDPDRFLAENVRKLPPHTYKPFGVGPRACIGRQFALHETLLSLATILHRYDLEPQPGYTLEVSETLTLKPSGLRLRVRPRA